MSPRRGERAADDTHPRRPFRCGPGRVTDICWLFSVMYACRGRVVRGRQRRSGESVGRPGAARQFVSDSLLNTPTLLETLLVTAIEESIALQPTSISVPKQYINCVGLITPAPINLPCDIVIKNTTLLATK